MSLRMKFGQVLMVGFLKGIEIFFFLMVKYYLISTILNKTKKVIFKYIKIFFFTYLRQLMLKIQKIRLTLPLLLLTILLFINNNYNNYYYIALCSFFDSIIIFSNFPFLLIWSNSKPSYYEDIFIDFSKLPLLPLDDKKKILYQGIYTKILIFSNSILFSALICYWRSKLTNMGSIFELAGITGGLIEMAACFNNLTGKISLFLIKKFIKIQISSLHIQHVSQESTIDEYNQSDNNRIIRTDNMI